MNTLPIPLRTVLRLAASNVFMTWPPSRSTRRHVFEVDQPLKLDFLWAGLCLVGAAYFIFRR